MIRYVHIGDQINDDCDEFAFYDTVVDRFIVIDGRSNFESEAQLREHLATFRADDLAERFLNLVPPPSLAVERKQLAARRKHLTAIRDKERHARWAKAWTLHNVDKQSYAAVGRALGVSHNRARSLCLQHERRLRESKCSRCGHSFGDHSDDGCSGPTLDPDGKETWCGCGGHQP